MEEHVRYECYIERRLLLILERVATRIGMPLNSLFVEAIAAALESTGDLVREVPLKVKETPKEKPCRNRTGFRGVTEMDGKFHAHICVKGKKINLGKFDTPEQASEAYELERAKQ